MYVKLYDENKQLVSHNELESYNSVMCVFVSVP